MSGGCGDRGAAGGLRGAGHSGALFVFCSIVCHLRQKKRKKEENTCDDAFGSRLYMLKLVELRPGRPKTCLLYADDSVRHANLPTGDTDPGWAPTFEDS